MPGVYSDGKPTAQTLAEFPIHDKDVWGTYRRALGHFGDEKTLQSYKALLPARYTDLDTRACSVDEVPIDYSSALEVLKWLEQQIDAFDVAYQRDEANWFEFWFIRPTEKGSEELGRVRLYRPLRG